MVGSCKHISHIVNFHFLGGGGFASGEVGGGEGGYSVQFLVSTRTRTYIKDMRHVYLHRDVVYMYCKFRVYHLNIRF